jgi:NAD(P)-dependent dehydrogenase (short-subunit alcohol dehydrogenase family)
VTYGATSEVRLVHKSNITAFEGRSSLIERLIDPKEIADFVTYLSSPLASAINGAALRIDGGIVRCVF